MSTDYLKKYSLHVCTMSRLKHRQRFLQPSRAATATAFSSNVKIGKLVSKFAALTTVWRNFRLELKQDVICASAGNHAQGVAFSDDRLNCRAMIVMPNSTPQLKIDAVKQHCSAA